MFIPSVTIIFFKNILCILYLFFVDALLVLMESVIFDTFSFLTSRDSDPLKWSNEAPDPWTQLNVYPTGSRSAFRNTIKILSMNLALFPLVVRHLFHLLT